MLHSSELVRPFQVVSHWETRSENSEKTTPRATPFNSEEPATQSSIAALPVVTFQVGETVIAYGSRTARLLILKKGAVAIVKEDTEIAKVTEPGAVFGELSILLDQPNKVDVRALEPDPFPSFHGWPQRSNREEEKKMNKQMIPAEIELVRQNFARLAPISDEAALAEVQSGPWPPPPNIPAAIAPASMTMK